MLRTLNLLAELVGQAYKATCISPKREPQARKGSGESSFSSFWRKSNHIVLFRYLFPTGLNYNITILVVGFTVIKVKIFYYKIFELILENILLKAGICLFGYMCNAQFPLVFISFWLGVKENNH